MFELYDDEKEKLREWLKEHDKKCVLAVPMNQGAIGGRLTYCFTPTGLGAIVKVKCGCGSEVTLTNFDDW